MYGLPCTFSGTSVSSTTPVSAIVLIPLPAPTQYSAMRPLTKSSEISASTSAVSIVSNFYHRTKQSAPAVTTRRSMRSSSTYVSTAATNPSPCR